MIKVLFVTRKWPPAIGGIEKYSVEVTKSLKQRVDLEVLSLKGRSDGRPPDLIKLFLFLYQCSILIIRRRNKFDVVHFSDLVLFPLAWLHWMISSKNARIITVHGLDMLYGRRAGIAPGIYRHFMKWAVNNRHTITHYIANSKNTADIAESMGFMPVTPVPLAAGSVISTSVTERNGNYIFFFGRIVKRKGVRWFIDEMLPLVSDDIKFVIAGKIWDRDELNGVSTKRVEYLGPVSEEKLTSLCSKALAVVLPNIAIPDNKDVEGFGLAAVEAAARGGVVIASDLEGIKDAVRHGETGFLVKPGDPDAWVRQIDAISCWETEERLKFINHSKSVVQKYYSWERVAKDTHDIYKSCIKNENQ